MICSASTFKILAEMVDMMRVLQDWIETDYARNVWANPEQTPSATEVRCPGRGRCGWRGFGGKRAGARPLAGRNLLVRMYAVRAVLAAVLATVSVLRLGLLFTPLACSRNGSFPMINTRTARMFAHYKAWADRLLFEGVAVLAPAEVVKERPTLFKTMIGTLNHNYVVDLIWQAHLEGREHGFSARNLVLHPRLDDLWQAQQKMNEWMTAWSDAQSDVTLDEPVHFSFISGERAVMTRGEILLHLVNHASYHRGWVCDMFFQVPAKPPTTDLPVFLLDAASKY
jgi:uncharacterized damage-inducible protein DinB